MGSSNTALPSPTPSLMYSSGRAGEVGVGMRVESAKPLEGSADGSRRLPVVLHKTEVGDGRGCGAGSSQRLGRGDTWCQAWVGFAGRPKKW